MALPQHLSRLPLAKTLAKIRDAIGLDHNASTDEIEDAVCALVDAQREQDDAEEAEALTPAFQPLTHQAPGSLSATVLARR